MSTNTLRDLQLNRNRLSGFYRAIVEDISDPLQLGRLKVRVLPFFDSDDISVDALPWAEPCYQAPMVIPPVNSWVWIWFEKENDPLKIIWFGNAIPLMKVEEEMAQVDSPANTDTGDIENLEDIGEFTPDDLSSARGVVETGINFISSFFGNKYSTGEEAGRTHMEAKTWHEETQSTYGQSVLIRTPGLNLFKIDDSTGDFGLFSNTGSRMEMTQEGDVNILAANNLNLAAAGTIYLHDPREPESWTSEGSSTGEVGDPTKDFSSIVAKPTTTNFLPEADIGYFQNREFIDTASQKFGIPVDIIMSFTDIGSGFDRNKFSAPRTRQISVGGQTITVSNGEGRYGLSQLHVLQAEEVGFPVRRLPIPNAGSRGSEGILGIVAQLSDTPLQQPDTYIPFHEELLEPKLNMDLFSKYMRLKYNEFGNWQDVASVFGSLSPGDVVKDSAGNYVNQEFVDRFSEKWEMTKENSLAVASHRPITVQGLMHVDRSIVSPDKLGGFNFSPNENFNSII